MIIVEDEEIIRNGLQDTIEWEDMGFKVLGIARDGRGGLALFKSLRPDVVLTDIKMPEFDGLRLLSEIKKTDHNTEVVLLTGYSEFEYAKQAVQFDAFAYILKMDLYSQLEPVFHKLRNHLNAVRTKSMEFKQLRSLFDSNRLMMAVREKKWTSLDIRGNCYCVAAIGECWENAKDTVASAAPENNVLFGEYGKYGVLLFYSDTEDDLRKNMESLFQQLRQSFFSNQMVIGAGDIVHQQGLVTGSYYEAMKMLDYGRLEKRNRFQLWAYGKTDLTPSAAEDRRLTDKAAMHLLFGKTELFRDYLDEYTKNAILSGHTTMLSVRTHLLDIFSRLSAVFDQSPFEARYSEVVAGICGCDSMLDACEFIDGILPEICRAVNHYRSSYGGNMQEILCFMDKNFNMNLKMEDVAKYFFISPPYFCTQFKKFTGMNFVDYIKKLRMEQAGQLLRSTNIKFSLIAKEVGYEDDKYFSKLFKATYKMSPQQYRQMHSQLNNKET